MVDALRAQVVVVGAGVAGLTAATYLARAGIDVLVVERASATGGRAASRVVDDFVFNLGVHALYTGGSASRTLEELGVTYQAGSPTTVVAMREGEFFPLPATAGQLLRSRLFTGLEKVSLIRFFAALAAAKPEKLGQVSLEAWLDAKVKQPRVRRFAEALAFPTVYTTALDVVSADVFVDKLQRAVKNPVHYLDNGWQTVVDGLETAARTAGARIALETRATALDGSTSLVHTVALNDGSTVETDRVIVATPPRQAARLLRTYPAGQRAVTDWSITPGHVACLDVALEKLPVPEHPVVQDLEQPRFMTTQSVYSQVAPNGAALIYSIKQLRPGLPNDPAAHQHDLEDLLDRAQPGWRDLLLHRRFRPQIEAVGTLPTAATGGFAGRPPVTLPEDPRVCLAGDWVGPEGFLIDACTASARQAADLCISRLDTRATASV